MAKTTSRVGKSDIRNASVSGQKAEHAVIGNNQSEERVPIAVEQQDAFHEAPVPKRARIAHDRKPSVVISAKPPARQSLQELAYVNTAKSKKSPSPVENYIVKSKTRTFNHTHEFALEDGIIWVRRIGRARWEPLYFDGFPDVIPVFIDCDGANLIVVDQLDQVHYKKVLKEYRQSECDFEKDPVLAAARNMAEGHPYVAVDISQENNWTPRWFKMPLIKHLANVFMERRLVIPKNARAVAISHRGRYNDYVEDKLLKRHKIGAGVTTLYALDENGQDIHKFDPWSPPWAKTIVPLPESETTSFIANNVSVSASTIMAIGYEKTWVTNTFSPKIITRLADIDTEGGNPALKYSFADNEDPAVRVLPFDEKWQEHPLELSGRAELTENITIRQTGEGNHMRELIVLGTDAKGNRGHYRKNLWEPRWRFIPSMAHKTNTRPLVPIDSSFSSSSVRNYTGRLKNYEAKLIDFGRRSGHSKIQIAINDVTHTVNLYRRFSLGSFFGFDSRQYDLVLPASHPDLIAIFGNKLAFEVHIKQDDNQVRIYLKGITHTGLKFEFFP